MPGRAAVPEACKEGQANVSISCGRQSSKHDVLYRPVQEVARGRFHSVIVSPCHLPLLACFLTEPSVKHSQDCGYRAGLHISVWAAGLLHPELFCRVQL